MMRVWRTPKWGSENSPQRKKNDRVYTRMRSIACFFLVLCWWLPVMTATQEVQLQAPLTTLVRLVGDVPRSAFVLRATIHVPADAPTDLGVGAYVADRHGRWFQRLRLEALVPGESTMVNFAMGPDEPLLAQPFPAAWNMAAAAQASRAGLFFWSVSHQRAKIRVDDLIAEAQEVTTALPRLTGLTLPGMNNGVIQAQTGARYEFSVNPQPFPFNPFDPGEFSLEVTFTAPDGREQRIAGFASEVMTLRDRGDVEAASATGPMRFLVRWRPQIPGTWSARMEAHWRDRDPLVVTLPPLMVSGESHDDIVRVDAGDPRFFSVEGRWFWPIGLNLHSTYDTRSRDRLGTVLTPERGTLAYADRFRRLAAAGCNATEVWMSAWNMALEWNENWPGYSGVGRFNQGNAAKLDAVLDAAQVNGLRINLVLNNHGQAAPDYDREWKDHPWNQANGGLLAEPYALFTDPRSLTGQANLRRYMVARYADHPAILGWKLWSEINLTAVGESQRDGFRNSGKLSAEVSSRQRLATLVSWHEGASAHLHTIDTYRHPVTTHWSGDYRVPNPEVCALSGIDYLCIDAYHHSDGEFVGSTIIDLIWNGVTDPRRGLGQFKKPVLVTEFGGSSQGTTNKMLAAELASTPWAAAMSGNAGMPFMWWFEWIDQGEHWQPFGAICRFLAGEDLRGTDARPAVLSASGERGPWWARSWVRSGKMLGYVANHRWTGEGNDSELHKGVLVRIGAQVAPGPCRVEWWDANQGIVLSVQTVDHPGGALDLAAPAFLHHIAFKMQRAAVTVPIEK